jgi:ankyrin repeat protein
VTPLLIALSNDLPDIAQFLLDAGDSKSLFSTHQCRAEFPSSSITLGSAPASSRNCAIVENGGPFEMISLLIKYGSQINSDQPDLECVTPLLIALGSAPASSRNCAISGRSLERAISNGVTHSKSG